MITRKDLYAWCRTPAEELEAHPGRKIALRLCADSEAMGKLMARDLADAVQANTRQGRLTRAIIPCGPNAWYRPFADLVNAEGIDLRGLVVFHMDECLDWQGRLLPRAHPYCFRGFMERHFYDPVRPELRVPEANRRWLEPGTLEALAADLAAEPADFCLGGWGQDGHVAYNQARRHPYLPVTVEELRHSSARVQENNHDTILALAQRTFGGAYQFVPPMSVTLGMREVLASRKVRLFSDTGAWKQTALRVALFGPVTAEYPITLLQEHPDALLTATMATADHPLVHHPEWDLGLEGEDCDA